MEAGLAMAISVSFINMKGGVGKTTLAMQVALAASRGHRVLAVDLDPQANLSHALLGGKGYMAHIQRNEPTVVRIFEGYMPSTKETDSPTTIGAERVIHNVRQYAKGKLDLISSRLELSRTLRNADGKERRLAEAVARVADRYDLIIVDCAPTDSVLTDAAYFASRYVLIPIKPEFMATIGLPLLARSLETFKEKNRDHDIDICGIVFVHSSSYTTGPEARESVAEVMDFAKSKTWRVFQRHIPYSRSYAKAARESSFIGWTSHVRSNISANFNAFMGEFYTAIGLKE